MLHDEKVYPDPLQFKPERFLTPDGLNTDKSVKFFAESTFWITIRHRGL
jgi:cytochrome P450